MVPLLSRHTTITDIDAPAWDRLAGENVFATHGFLRTVEACCRAPIEPIYFTLHRSGVLIAASVCHIVGPSPGIESIDDMVFGRVAGPARAVGLSLLPALVSGPAIGYGWHLGIDPGLDARDARESGLTLLDAMEAEAGARGLRVSLPQVLDDEGDLPAWLTERRYLRCRNVPVAVLDLPFASFEDYLAHLPRKSRSESRRQTNRNRDSGTVIDLTDAVDDIEGRLQELIDLNSQKHNGLPFALGPGFLGALRRHLGGRARVFVARKSGAITGVCAMLMQGATACPIAVGIDAELAAGDYTYFQVTYHAPIAHVIASGMRRIYYGRGLEDVKARRGCRFANTWTYLCPGAAQRPVTVAWFLGASAWNRFKLSARVRRSLKAVRS